jgi:hypothetical protein
MNASMNDTHNLAWKLLWVLRGWAKPAVLGTVRILIALDRSYNADVFRSSVRA